MTWLIELIKLMEEFVGHLRKAGVEKINTLVGWHDWQLIRFFSSSGFAPAKTINLELDIDYSGGTNEIKTNRGIH